MTPAEQLAVALVNGKTFDDHANPRWLPSARSAVAGAFAADPALAAALDLGLAWQEAEAALPDEALLSVAGPHHPAGPRYTAMAMGPVPIITRYGQGDTHAAALRALAEKLR